MIELKIRNRDFLLKILVAMTLLIAVGLNVHTRYKRENFPLQAELRLIMPDGEGFKRIDKPFLYYEVYKKKVLLGYCFDTKDIAPFEKGFSGHIELLVGVDKFGKVQNVKVLKHNETYQYASEINSTLFLGQFKGKGYKDEIIVGKDIDGITRATISSNAICRILKTSLDKMQVVVNPSLPLHPREVKTRVSLNWDFYITVLIIIFFLATWYLKTKLLRNIGLGISIIYLGFLKANFISTSNLGKILLWNLPDFRTELYWFVLIFSGIILSFLISGFYCSYICPFGGIQIFLNKIFRFKLNITSALAGKLRKIRYILLWLLTIIVLMFNNPTIADYEPFSTVFLRRGSIISWTITLIIIGLSLVHYRPFCNYFCATGAFMDILAKWHNRIFKTKRHINEG